MKKYLIENLEKISWGVIAIFIIGGLFLNFQLTLNVRYGENEILIPIEEKEYIESIFIKEDRNIDFLEKQYLAEIKKIESSGSYNEEYIGKLYYFLGYNSYLDNDYKKTVKYLEEAKNIFMDRKNYFYLLNLNNILMNIAYFNNEQIKGVEIANEIYGILEKENIEGISISGQKGIKANVLTGLIDVSSEVKMEKMAEIYYLELIEITKDKRFENNMTIYAKYIYNLRIENYSKAKEYAKEYIEDSKKYLDESEVAKSHIYLLEALIYNNEFDEATKVFKIIEEDNENENIKGIILKLKGVFYEKQKDYENSKKNYDEALDIFEINKNYESMQFVLKNIVKLNMYIDIDIKFYVNKLDDINKIYDEKEFTGDIADKLNEISYKRINEEKERIEDVFTRKQKLTKISKRINIIYLGIIVILIWIAKKLKNEIKSRKGKELELEKMIRTDYLTKAYSKQFIFDKTKEYILNKKEFSMIIFDLDNFKRINDSYGHNFGDEVLVSVTREIKELVGENGYIGRFGGEEFIIILNGDVNINEFGERLIDKVRNSRFSIDDVSVTISGGGIIYDNQKNVESLIYDADILLYKAKAEGKDKILIR